MIPAPFVLMIPRPLSLRTPAPFVLMIDAPASPTIPAPASPSRLLIPRFFPVASTVTGVKLAPSLLMMLPPPEMYW
jgi:hypothetical protein